MNLRPHLPTERLQGRRPRRHRRTVEALVLTLVVSMAVGFAPPSADDPVDSLIDCVGPAGEAEPGTPEWEQRDLENRYCARQGTRDTLTNPAFWAALGESYPANASTDLRAYPLASRDPFRAPQRWNEKRGRYDITTFTNGDGASQRLTVFRPLEGCGRTGGSPSCPEGVPRHVTRSPYPGVLIFDYVGRSQEVLGAGHFQQAQTLAEHGYLVGIGTWPVGTDTAPDALDFFLSTPDEPNEHGEFNPFWEDLDHGRIGLAGLSGNSAQALTIGFADPRVDAIVGWDPARSAEFSPDRAVPTMFIDGDYFVLPEERETDSLQGDEQPAVVNGRHYDRLAALGYDTMQVVARAGTHIDSARPTGCLAACSRYGGAVVTYYTLAWFDRYLIGSKHGATAKDARERLMGGIFDGSSDASAIGMGTFDAEKARAANDVLAGNQPITLEGLRVADRLSFYYPSRYHLDGGRHRCDDMRTGLRDGGC